MRFATSVLINQKEKLLKSLDYCVNDFPIDLRNTYILLAGPGLIPGRLLSVGLVFPSHNKIPLKKALKSMNLYGMMYLEKIS